MQVKYPTGRVYDFAQVLEINYDAETRTAVFSDKSRGITGRVSFKTPISESNLGPMTLHKYNRNDYDWHPTQYD